MGSDQLLERIRLGGARRVRELEAGRERELAAIAERRDAALAELEREFRARIEQSRRLILDRARSRAGLERRKQLLAARWQVVDRVLATAREKLLADPEYPELLVELAARYTADGATVRFSPADTERIGRRPGLEPGEPADIGGGLLVVTGRQVTDCSLDEAVAGMRGELAAIIVRELFPE